MCLSSRVPCGCGRRTLDFPVPCAGLTPLDGPRAPGDAALPVRAQGGGPQAGQRAAVVLGARVVVRQRHAADLSGFLEGSKVTAK